MNTRIGQMAITIGMLALAGSLAFAADRIIEATPRPASLSGVGGIKIIDRQPIVFGTDPNGATWTVPSGEVYQLERVELMGQRTSGGQDEIRIQITPLNMGFNFGRTISISAQDTIESQFPPPLNGIGLMPGDEVRAFFLSGGAATDAIGFRLTLRRHLIHADSNPNP